MLRTATRHGLAPALYRSLAASDAASIPTTVMTALRDIYTHSKLRTAAMHGQFRDVLAILRRARVSIIALKGLHLSAVAYSDPALRPMVDLDLLVQSQDLSAVEREPARCRIRPEHTPF